MPDISMCANRLCSKNLECYRFTANPSTCQSYMGYAPDAKGDCDGFIPILKGKEG